MPSLPGSLSRLSVGTVIHLHVAQAFVPEVVYLTHLRHKVPYVAHLHIDVGPSGPAGWLLKLYKPYILKYVLRAAASVVCSRRHGVAVGKKYGIDGERIHVIPNGVDEGFFFYGLGDPRSTSSVVRGQARHPKNLPLLLRALVGISDRFETTLVGVGELEQIGEMAESLHLRNVRFHGRADGEELLSLYRRSDILFCPLSGKVCRWYSGGHGDGVARGGDRYRRHQRCGGTWGDGHSGGPNSPVSTRQALLDLISDRERYQKMR